MTNSVFSEYGWRFIERGISVVPIAPGTKKPGQWSKADGWRGMSEWTRFAERFPTEIEMAHWEELPEAGVGIVLGKLSGIVALDKDYDVPGSANDELERLIPYSPYAKKGEKGWTKFYRYNGEKSCSFDVGGKRVLDVLSDGRQTVIPPTIHPSGCSYVWISPESLESIVSSEDLPTLPADFFQKLEALLAPLQTKEDNKHQRKSVAPKDDEARINTDLSIQAEYFRDMNREALSRLDEWVPKLVPTAHANGEGYRCVATWRNCTSPNVGIHPNGITDFGGNYGMTPLDLVMYANGLIFHKAAEVLRSCLSITVDHISMTVGGSVAPETQSKVLPPLPWVKSVELSAVPTVMLPPDTSVDVAAALPSFITNPPGVLNDIANWITATAPKAQAELSLAAAIALAAAATQRQYRSNLGNFTSLYIAMVAKSTEGKEHPQSCVERALTAAGLQNLIAGSGYTSAGAVFSALNKSPSHIAIIDEMGKLLKMSRAKGNSNSEAAIDKLVEAFGKLNGVIRPPVYSTMTLSKAQVAASSLDDRVIHNPAISLLMATTPGTFYGNLTDDLVQDGFLGRLIVVESTQPRQLARFVDQADPPARIIEWLQEVSKPAKNGNLEGLAISDMPAHTTAMHIGEDCQNVMRALETELNDIKDQLEGEALDVLLGRTAEKALRLSMIVTKACNPRDVKVKVEHFEWAIKYVRHYDMAMIRAVRKHRVVNQDDANLKKAIEYIRGAVKIAGDKKFANYAHIMIAGGMPHSLLLKRMHMKSRDFRDMIDQAVEVKIISKVDGVQMGYVGDVYYLLDSD